MLGAVGNTPLVRLKRMTSPGAAEVWVKLEGVNPTGSYKDRMALAMVEGAEQSGELIAGVSLLECTGGSTGSSLAFVCAVKGHRFTVISSDAYAREKLDSMRAYGATVLVEPSIGGEVTPDLWPRMIERARHLVDGGGYLYLDQFQNPHAPTGYRSMGEEIVSQLTKPIDALCGAVGTAGMITGVGGAIRATWPDARIVALEPDTSPVLSGGVAGPHGIDGTAAGFVPPNFDSELVTEVMALPESEARKMARRLANEEGIFAGTSTGLNVVAALRLADEIGPGGTVVTVACDTGFKYLDGPLFRDTDPLP
jgi:cysteine synthase